jgi:uncharacterized protein YacL
MLETGGWSAVRTFICESPQGYGRGKKNTMTPDLLSRLIGLILFALLGARLGADAAPLLGLPVTLVSIVFSMVGVLLGLLIGPWVSVRPVRAARKMITELPVESLFTSLFGLAIGLGTALLLAYPLSLLNPPVGSVLPFGASFIFGYLGFTIFRVRAKELISLFAASGGKRARGLMGGTDRMILLDTSVLIDGRVVDIAKTGFIGGTLCVPRFVIDELHQVADSADTLRRNRGRHGLSKLNELQRDGMMPFKIIEEEVPGIVEVDDKLVALALRMHAPIITNDYPLNRIAETQGVVVLNVNSLANAVRSIFLPGDTLPIRIIQEGREADQGVGYLEDGTMVVVEGGKNFMDRTITVSVTKFINKDTGRMFFAVPEKK